MELKQIESEITKIQERNKRVELNKKWEMSFTRKVIVAVLTYLVIVVFFYVAELPDPLINSIVPTAAFVISTLSLSFFKKIWEKYRRA
ncbi:hypothetical protein ACFL3C_00650 [Patescibacteria group bacterium]